MLDEQGRRRVAATALYLSALGKRPSVRTVLACLRIAGLGMRVEDVAHALRQDFPQYSETYHYEPGNAACPAQETPVRGAGSTDAIAEHDAAFRLLRDAGLSNGQIGQLVREADLDEIRQQIEALPYRQPRNAPAMLVRSIVERWPLPAQYMKDRSHLATVFEPWEDAVCERLAGLEFADAKAALADAEAVALERHKNLDRSSKSLPRAARRVLAQKWGLLPTNG